MIILTILTFSTIISFIMWRKTDKTSLKKTFKLIFTLCSSVLVLTVTSGFILAGIFSWIEKKGNAREDILKEVSSQECSSGKGRIKKYEYTSFADFIEGARINTLITYENSKKVVYLNDIGKYTSTWSLKQFADKNNFVKNSVDNSERGDSFPVYDYMRKSLIYKVIDQNVFEKDTVAAKSYIQSQRELKGSSRLEEGYASTPPPSAIIGTYINPEKISQLEFEDIANCVEENQALAKVNILVYVRPNLKLSKESVNIGNNYFTEMGCFNNAVVTITNSGVVESGYYKKFPSGRYEIIEKLLLGYFDVDGSFTREKNFSNFSYNSNTTKLLIPFTDKYINLPLKTDNNTTYLKDTGFTKAYQESQTLKLLFNENQEPINDYLKTCKNTQGKTVFDIFKAE